jgi:hypothetical protein
LAGKQQQPAPNGFRSQQRFPGTLADGTAAGTQGRYLSPQAAMDSVFTRK